MNPDTPPTPPPPAKNVGIMPGSGGPNKKNIPSRSMQEDLPPPPRSNQDELPSPPPPSLATMPSKSPKSSSAKPTPSSGSKRRVNLPTAHVKASQNSKKPSSSTPLVIKARPSPIWDPIVDGKGPPVARVSPRRPAQNGSRTPSYKATPNAERRSQSRERRTPSTERRTSSSERRTPSYRSSRSPTGLRQTDL